MNTEKYKSLESILDKTGNINSAILRQEYFKKTKIYQDVLNQTKCLDIFNGITFSQRVIFLIEKLEIKKCPKCNKLYIFFKKSQKTFSLCNHKKNIKVNYSKNVINRIKKTNNQFCESINDLNLKLPEKDFYDKVHQIIKKQENYAFIISKENFDFYHDCILRTITLLPFDKNNFKLSERIYCLENNIKKIPTCKFCNNPVQFLNRIKGYQISCSKCSQLKNNETRSFNLKEKIDQLINLSKYEIIQYPSLLNYQPLIIKCKKCGKASEWILNNGHLNQNELFNRLCKNCETVSSKSEEELFQFIKSIYNGKVIHKNGGRKIIKPLELDIYIPDKKLAIEYNGIYWHQSSEFDLNDIKHVKKTELCEKKDIQLVQIFEDQWNSKKELIKNKIKNLLGIYSYIIFARKCKVKEIFDNNISKNFLNENHLQGNSNSKVKLGLFYEEKLISIMTFGKPRFDKKHDWELIRYCSKNNYHIPGGASKLLKYFERNYKPKSLVSYADRCWSIGNLYKILGFNLIHKSKPNYWYIKGNIKLSRIKCQKHKLKKLLKNYNPTLSEYQNMKNNGYFRIFDCGNMVFEKNKA